MSPDSVLLISDKVLSDDEPHIKYYTSGLSLNMYSLFKCLERKKRQWLQLLDDAGFKARDVRFHSSFQDAVIEAVLK